MFCTIVYNYIPKFLLTCVVVFTLVLHVFDMITWRSNYIYGFIGFTGGDYIYGRVVIVVHMPLTQCPAQTYNRDYISIWARVTTHILKPLPIVVHRNCGAITV